MGLFSQTYNECTYNECIRLLSYWRDLCSANFHLLSGGGLHPLEAHNYIIFQFIYKPISYSDIYNWGPISTQKDVGIFSLQVRAVTPADPCVTFTGCSNHCFNLSAGNSLNCSSTTAMSYANARVKLPAGWFLICGEIAYSYVPAYSTGAPCSFGRLTVFLPQKPHQVRHRRELTLDPSCNSDVHLFSTAEYVSLSLFVVPAITIALCRD